MAEKPESEEKQVGQRNLIPIVGIGASAGGLEALREFFNNTPVDTGMTFIVITHQHPGHESLLADILSRETAMPVIKIIEGTCVEPDHVYVLGSGFNLVIEEMKLHLKELHDAAIRMPIDIFFRSLAEDAHEQAVGIVLSGTGSDGTRGIREIKGHGGLTLAQEIPSALYGGMPGNARNTGLVDFVLKPAEMTRAILDYFRMLPAVPGEHPERDENITTDDINVILRFIRSRLGHDFSSYKQTTVERRILRRMSVHSIVKAVDYLNFLHENQQESQMLLSELLIGVTNFFRDPEAFIILRDKFLPAMIQSWPDGQDFRVWVAGCATGEEAYSLAIILEEVREQYHKSFDIRIFATDLDNESIEIARKGMYSGSISVDVSSPRLSRFFSGSGTDGYTVRKEIRDMVVFAQHNMLSDPPFLKLQLLVCRNVLIYFQGDIQKKLLPLFHHALNPGGLLFLGLSESVGTDNRIFEPLDIKLKIFRRADVATVLPGMPFKLSDAQTAIQEKSVPATVRTTTDRLVEKILLEHFVPVTIVFDREGTITYIHGRTGAFLEPEQRRPRNNVYEMAREGLKMHLKTAVNQVLEKKGPIVKRSIRVKSDNGFTTIDLTISRILNPEALRGLLMAVITPSGGKALPVESTKKPEEIADTLSSSMVELQRELDYIRDINQSLVEEMQSNKEEMQSANEELQSTNEELQSSKEEMESLNEELSTVNSELNVKVQELAQARDDIQNLLNSTDLAVIFLDRRLCVKRYTPRARTLVNLRDSDIGRPISDLNLKVHHENLFTDSHHVLNTLERREREVVTVDGRKQLMRILPYRSSEDLIGGVVVTFVDITDMKNVENALRKSEEQLLQNEATLNAVLDALPAGVMIADINGKIIRFNPVARELWGEPPETGSWEEYRNWIGWWPETGQQIKPEEWALTRALHEGLDIRNELVLNQKFGSEERRYYLNNAVPLLEKDGKITGAVAATLDVTTRILNEKALQRRNEELGATNRDLEAFSFSVSHDLRNPLQNIYNFINFLLEKYTDGIDNEGKDMLNRIKNSATKMRHIIDDLLTLSHISRQELKCEMIDLSAIVRNHLDELSAGNPQRHVEWIVPDNLMVNADKRLMHLAIENLLQNAWKFTSKKLKACIELGCLEKNGESIYFIRDDGIGFDMKFAEKIFEPFIRTHSDKEFSGTGIGLSIVERIIRRHGGKVWAEGSPDNGATIYFTLQ